MKKKYLVFILQFIHIIYIYSYVYANQDNNYIESELTQKNILSLECDSLSRFSLSKSLNKDIIHVVADKETNTLVSTIIPIKINNSSYCTDAADYLKNVPGFSIKRNGGTNNDLVFRGTSGSRIRILTDNSEIIGVCCARMDPASSYINPENFDTLKIIKGPQTVLYGPSVSGGILQFQRYHPCFQVPQIRFHSDITFGSNNSINKYVDSTVGNKYGYIRLIGNLAHSDDYYDGNNSKVNSAWYKWNTDAILAYFFKDLDTHIEINVGQGNSRVSYINNLMDGLCFEKENYRLKIETVDINDFLSKIELHTWHHHIYHLMVDNILYANSLEKKLSNSKHNCCGNRITDLNRFLWGMRSIITCDWENIKCYYGIDTQINHYKKNSKYDHSPTIDIYIQDIGIFNECILHLLSNQKLIGGVRIERTITNIYEYNSILNHNYIMYPTGFIRYENEIQPSLSYYIGIGTSQDFPNYWELMSTKCIKNIKKTDQIFRLKPETTIQIDTGINFTTSKINGWISSYFGCINNYLYINNKDYIANNIINSINNIHVQIYGSEMELNYKFNNYWYGKSNISWSWGVNIDDQCILPVITPLEGTLICQFQKKNYRLEASWRLVASSKYIKKIFSIPYIMQNSNNFFYDDINIPGFGVFSIYATWNKVPKPITYSIGVNNLFNQSYIEYSNRFITHKSEESKSTFRYEPGRTWWIKATIKL